MSADRLTLSVVIPCLNEAERLPLLLADLQRWPLSLEITLVDDKEVRGETPTCLRRRRMTSTPKLSAELPTTLIQRRIVTSLAALLSHTDTMIQTVAGYIYRQLLGD